MSEIKIELSEGENNKLHFSIEGAFSHLFNDKITRISHDYNKAEALSLKKELEVAIEDIHDFLKEK